MGIGGALMWPAILGMTFAALPAEKAGLAGGLILGAAGIGNAVGPLIGGVLTDLLSWRWIFFLNVPIAALPPRHLRKVHQPQAERRGAHGLRRHRHGLGRRSSRCCWRSTRRSTGAGETRGSSGC